MSPDNWEQKEDKVGWIDYWFPAVFAIVCIALIIIFGGRSIAAEYHKIQKTACELIGACQQ